MNDARLAFSSTLRSHREQHGITISDIAESTKISAGLLEALERSDLSRWPKGIFKRAFFREYVAAIGLPPESLVSEFARLFPDQPDMPAIAIDRPADFRLVLAETPRPVVAALKRMAVAGAELAAIALVGAAGAWLFAADIWSTCGGAALVYYPVSNLCVERRMGLRGLRALVTSELSTLNTQPPRREGVEGEELQVSY